MNNLIRNMVLVVVSLTFIMSTFADVVDTGAGRVNVGNPNVKYGPSFGYNPNGTSESNLANLKKRAKELRQAKKDLQTKKRKAKGRQAKKKVQAEIDKVSKELKKVFDDYDFEDGLTTNPRKPKNKHKARIWKRQQRHLRLKKLEAKQKKWEERQKKKKARSKTAAYLRDNTDVTIADIAVAQEDVMNAVKEVEDVQDRISEFHCDLFADENYELCLEFNYTKNNLLGILEEYSSYLKSLVYSLPPIRIGKEIYDFSDKTSEAQESYKYSRSVNRELINCVENCHVVERRVGNIQNSIKQQEELNNSLLNDIKFEMNRVDVVLEPIGSSLDLRDIVNRDPRLGRGPKRELGFCCEEVGELTCEGCIAGKRTRKSCKALNKLPGYNFKAFLRAKDLKCTKL